MAVENWGSLKSVNVYNNIIYNNAATGIDVSWYSTGPVDNILIVSNTIYNNGLIDEWGAGISLDYDQATNVIVMNNIVSKNKHKSIRVNDFDGIIENNLIDGYFGGEDETRQCVDLICRQVRAPGGHVFVLPLGDDLVQVYTG